MEKNYLKDNLMLGLNLEENDEILQNVVTGYSVNSFNDDGNTSFRNYWMGI